MKKPLVLCVALALTGFNAFALNENVIVWEEIYNRVDSDAQRYQIMLKITEMNDRDFAPMIQTALDSLVASRLSVGTVAERQDKIALAKLLVAQLGSLKSAETADSVFEAYKDAPDPILKAAAATSLGMMRATQYAESLSFDLAAINEGPVASRGRDQEILALGLVRGLEAMRSPLGYEQVFLASFGWYSAKSTVRDAAAAAASAMVDDPTDGLTSVFKGNPSLEIKLQAVRAELASGAPEDRKRDFAAMALLWGLDRVEEDPLRVQALRNVRVAAVNGLIALGDKDAGRVSLFTRLFEMDKRNDATLEESSRALVALGTNGSDEAAKYMAAALTRYNSLQRSDANAARDKMLIKQLVSAMKLSNNPLVKNALLQAKYIDYDASILRMVDDALKSFQ